MTAPDRIAERNVQPLRPEVERGTRLTDVGNGERFALRHGDDVRYCHHFASWYVYDGKRFRLDDNGEIQRRAKKTRARYTPKRLWQWIAPSAVSLRSMRRRLRKSEVSTP